MATVEQEAHPQAGMRPGLTRPHERRRAVRRPPGECSWHARAVVRPGQDVLVLNLSLYGALVESATPLRPGRATELQLTGEQRPKQAVKGRIDRSHVACLDPLRYRAAIVFDQRFEAALQGG